MAIITIIEQKTGEVVHTIKTGKTGANLEKLLNGLERKVDRPKFDIIVKKG